MTSQIRTALAPFALFALGFVAVSVPLSLGLRAASPMPDMLVLSPKLEAYRAAPEQYDTVFIGTSRTFYHIVPDEVERGAAEAGCPDWKVFNFGVFGLSGTEEDWLTQQVVEAGGDHIKRIVIEDPLQNERTLSGVLNSRARYFQGPQFWAGHVDAINTFPESLPKRAFRGGLLALGIGYDLSGVGRGAELAFPPAKPEAPMDMDLEMDGFEALGSKPTPELNARHAEFVNNPQGFTDNLARYGAPSDEDITLRAHYLAERLDRLKAKGMNAALYISPDLGELDRTPRTGEAVKALGDYQVLNFNRPDVYPDLFQRDLWFDFSHLGEAGARKLSVEVGREYCTLSKGNTDTASYALR